MDMTRLPRVELREGRAYLDGRELKLLESVGQWMLMAVVDVTREGPAAVFEDLAHDGSIAYVRSGGELIVDLGKRQESTRNDESACYGGHQKQVVVRSNADIMGRELLARDEEPNYASVEACLPPIRAVNSWGDCGEAPHTYIGTRESNDVIPIYYGVRSSVARIHHNYVTDELERAINAHTVMEGLIGGWLPVVLMTYPVDEDSYWTFTAFAKAHSQTAAVQPTWFRYLKVKGGSVAEVHYYDSYLPYPLTDEPGPEAFYQDLLGCKEYWEAQLGGGMELNVTAEPWVADFCKHSMVNDLITRFGDSPRYGLVIKNYGSTEHDGFQDILTSGVDAYLEWGRTDLAKALLVNYFDHYVKDSGQLAYRGPEIGQYGRMLTGLSQYFNYTGDASLAERYEKKIMAITDILLTRREAAKQLPKDSAEYGMIKGRHEADISFVHPEYLHLDFERPYFSNSTEAWRGLRDSGQMWRELGERGHKPEWRKRGESLVSEADALNGDIVRALERSILTERGGRFLPPIAGAKVYYYDYPYRSLPDSFDDNRVWCEMMHSGVVPEEYVRMLYTDAQAHNGMKLGIFGNRDVIVAFICYGQAYGLIQHDMIREYLLFFYAHALHLHTRGTWTAFECVDADRDRASCTGVCPPAQMTVPAITKWMIAFEDPLEETLHLCKATPREWLRDGEKIELIDAPTRHGKVSLKLCSHIASGIVDAQLCIPEGWQTVQLRLRVPDGKRIQSVWMGDAQVSVEMLDEETIQLPCNARGELTMQFRYE